MRPSSTPEADHKGTPTGEGREEVALVLGGGNALGAYLAGAYEHLHERGVRPDRIVGASIGAVTGAILAGNPPERRLERLKAFWAEATLHTVGAAPADLKGRQVHNGTHVALTALLGRPSIFGHRYPGLWSLIPGVPSDVALYDHAPLRRTLERLVDFDRLNRAETRFTLACTDIETGDDIYFDNTRHEIGPEHILASAALAPLFPPVEIDGRLLCDPGYANNLPLDPVFEEAPERDLVCVAIDLFSLRSPRPASLDAVLERAQDIISPAREGGESRHCGGSTRCTRSCGRRGRGSGWCIWPTRRRATSWRPRLSTTRDRPSGTAGPPGGKTLRPGWPCSRSPPPKPDGGGSPTWRSIHPRRVRRRNARRSWMTRLEPMTQSVLNSGASATPARPPEAAAATTCG